MVRQFIANCSYGLRPGFLPRSRCRPRLITARNCCAQPDRMGLIKKGYEANLLLVDGNPLKEISVTERISMVMFKGERVDRSELFDQQ